ncbi:MAG: hypothetical protein JNL41_00110 [Phenylobacterium sp.]|uniref:hypothetical protein n=1 Tax=Phenylobacterium sp. TaxID=1871053 RepID=UPI001A3A31A1|nr:hypothetical protein [Phenylobacterium sp.]MBL8552648.1 hypothetical protein [Phenylobacterium sp.]
MIASSSSLRARPVAPETARRLARRALGALGLRKADAAGDRGVVVEARLADGIGLHHFGLAADGCHPFVRAAAAGRDCPEAPDSAIVEVLRAYYDRVIPGNAADWLGLWPASASPDLLWAPPWAATLPWQTQTPAEWRAAREKGVPNENRLAGRELSIRDGWHACGPVSDQKAAVEAHRVGRLLASLQEHGLRRHDGRDGDIDAVLLRGEGVQRWWVNSGHHRAAVMSALGYETAPVRIRRVVDLRDVAQWPQVRSGLFQAADAARIVERLLAGELPGVAQAWAHWASGQTAHPLKATA